MDGGGGGGGAVGRFATAAAAAADTVIVGTELDCFSPGPVTKSLLLVLLLLLLLPPLTVSVVVAPVWKEAVPLMRAAWPLLVMIMVPLL